MGSDIRQHISNVANATELRSLAFTERLCNERRYKDALSFEEPGRHVHLSFLTRKKIEKFILSY